MMLEERCSDCGETRGPFIDIYEGVLCEWCVDAREVGD